MGRAFSSSYLDGDARALSLVGPDFRDVAQRRAVVQAAAARRVSPALVAALRAQQAELAARTGGAGAAARAAGLDALEAGGAAAVVTGQQVGLFLGPLYTFYKAASAVAVARALQAETGTRCVPIFWLQTEDHDFDEIASCAVADADGAPVRVALQAGDVDARMSVGHRVLGEEVTGLLQALADALPHGPAAEEVLAILRAAYAPGRRMAAAFAAVIARLFADEGLVVLDARDAHIAALARPVYAEAIRRAEAIEAALHESAQALDGAGFDQQVAVRDGSALVFFHRESPTGPRFRLARGANGGVWTLAGGGDQAVTEEELLATLAEDPLRFSTSALLRPVVQDALLPTAAYVAGPGEINYFAQLGPVYRCFGLRRPLLVPRARFRVVDARTARRLEKLGLTAEALDRPREEWTRRIAAVATAGAGVGLSAEEVRRRVDDRLLPEIDELTRRVAEADAQLAKAARRTRETVARALGRLVDRHARALLGRDEVTRRRLERVEAALRPSGLPQERFYGWPSLAGRYGAAELKRLVLERLAAVGPFTTALQELRP